MGADGKMINNTGLKTVESNKCTKLNCDEQEIPPIHCCPVCVNVNFYEQANSCDPNAICNNSNYGAECQCKMALRVISFF
ncbi:hypothetical protein QQG55_42070 [Brugia pahangi]